MRSWHLHLGREDFTDLDLIDSESLAVGHCRGVLLFAMSVKIGTGYKN